MKEVLLEFGSVGVAPGAGGDEVVDGVVGSVAVEVVDVDAAGGCLAFGCFEGSPVLGPVAPVAFVVGLVWVRVMWV